ncbi:MAG: prepilin peptidase [Solobacterium sp.]|nr:prepilin peptidase [Solobacterium sp.]MBQ6355820.1 prepilin peptidase [Solobacterium sp.]MBQ6532542.1 prepilin peptidase [Solobacterium sp.]MBR0213996.1 prepilin peptidase [Solobacterium sp.]
MGILFLNMLSGASLGSFACCMIIRLKAHRPVWGRSVCEHCGQVLKPADLIPVISYIRARGRCRYCGCRISPETMVFEGIGALAGLLFTVSRGW